MASSASRSAPLGTGGGDQGGVEVDLCQCEATLMREIGDERLTTADVATTYAMAMRSAERPDVDWERVNRAIANRWGVKALRKIKNAAVAS